LFVDIFWLSVIDDVSFSFEPFQDDVSLTFDLTQASKQTNAFYFFAYHPPFSRGNRKVDISDKKGLC
jgi:hypothetical protein